jgi:U2 small nuclear ribonucleoprotein B''
VNIARSLTLSAERKQAQEAAAAAAAPAKRAPEDTLAERPGKSAKPSAAAGGQVPDEYLPPNKTLFLRDLPEDYGKDMLAIIFKRYPGFREIRLVPGRNTIAFAEYEDETGATAAKEALANLELSSQKIKITYQRQ